ncbi:hypothetical protein CDAR_573191 [Caerostris darwini]|uniref:Uncharacterized protein n=1 Tax=Caerostris darwini TaxID=1538125 RepID=A0AAV4W7V7_9ARAC|nr:hypothetical protein CDAR_573191 [Caerostris darwini]
MIQSKTIFLDSGKWSERRLEDGEGDVGEEGSFFQALSRISAPLLERTSKLMFDRSHGDAMPLSRCDSTPLVVLSCVPTMTCLDGTQVF